VFERRCPQCQKPIRYTNKHNCNRSERLGRRCKSCVAIDRNKLFDYRGEKGPFYGRKHTEETKRLLSQVDKSRWKTEEFRRKMSSVTRGERNPMFGRTVDDIWLQKYGPEEAARRAQERSRKKSLSQSGANNRMYGKSPPRGCGAGWSGWYKGWYFRSLRELSYVIGVLEPAGVAWVSGEKLRLKYVDHDGRTRTHSPDFLVNQVEIVEVKPARLQNTPSVLAKRSACEEYCRLHGLTYKMVDPKLIADSVVVDLYVSGQVVFIRRWDEVFRKKYLGSPSPSEHNSTVTSF
jgi:hypothetical protein